VRSFPFVSVSVSILVLRLSLALIFFLHAMVRIMNGSIGQFAEFLNDKGLVAGTAIVWAITAFEIAGSVLLALGYFTRLISAGFIVMLIVGIILIHASLGWFVGEHGTGGSEYSFILIVGFVVVAASSKK
jgi:putative oxidoreductase